MSSAPDSPSPAADRARPPIPDFVLIRKIGEGGYGEVWLARGVTGALRAVKIVWHARSADPAPFEREFRGVKECMALASDSSPLALLHVGRNEEAGCFYYVMELADDARRGRDIDPAAYVPLTLKELRARRGRLPAAECVRHGTDVARALAALHARGLLHRDIKPSNIILVSGTAKLADIGLVAAATDAQTFVGTEGFVPPEGPGSPAADVFALGKVLYELATGLDRGEFPQMPADLGAPAERQAFFALNQVLLRACDPAPARRHRDGAELLADLEVLERGGSVPRRAGRRTALGWLAVAATVALVGAALVSGLWNSTPPAAAGTGADRPAPGTNAPVSPARQLVARAWAALERTPEPFRAELEVAGEFCRRAAELDSGDAEVWAAWSHVEGWYIAQNLDRTPARQESALTKAARAMSLAPESYEARLAQACSFLRAQSFNTPTPSTAEAERLLRALLRERPGEPRTLLALAHLLYGRYQVDESAALFDQLARQPGWAATAYNGKGWVLQSVGRWDEAWEAGERSLAAKPFFGNAGLHTIIARTWLGDLDRAKAAANRFPAADLREDAGLTMAVQVYWWRREPKEMMRLLQNVPRDWLQSNAYWGPKDYWIGAAHDLAGNREAAHFAWRNALRQVDERLALGSSYDALRLHLLQGRLLALLGEKEAALAAFGAVRQFGMTQLPAVEAALLGDFNRARPGLEKASWAFLRHLPDLDPLRDDPRFQAILTAATRDPRRAPLGKR